MVLLICPTCQNVFAGNASMPATTPVTLHGVVFDILVGSENRVGNYGANAIISRPRSMRRRMSVTAA
jgi:hypothetical protein